MFKRLILGAAMLVCLFGLSGRSIGQLNVPRSGGAASVRDGQAEIPRLDNPAPRAAEAGTLSVSANWLAAQNETLLDSIRLLTTAVSPEEFRKYQEAEKSKTAGKDQSFVLDHRNKFLHDLVKGAVRQ